MKKHLFISSVMFMFILACGQKENEPVDLHSFEVVFQDEFASSHLDRSKWESTTSNPKPFDRVLPRQSCDYSNAEVFLDTNIVLDGEYLHLILKEEDYVYTGRCDGKTGDTIACGFVSGNEFILPQKYTSGTIRGKTGYTRGFFEIRAKLPSCPGLYPVFWLWHHDEIVVLEFFGDSKDHYVSSHNKAHYITEKFNHEPDYSDSFHKYSVSWTPNRIVWYFDRKPIKAIYRTEQDLIRDKLRTHDNVSVEVASIAFPDSIDRWLAPNISLRTFEWSEKIDSQCLPDTFSIDYIKIYQKT